ncbi:MAG: hypothetical protein JWQ98_340 [Chlorobi bacterium]|nr:hypothetical protein [Chlorobiota bacterium]
MIVTTLSHDPASPCYRVEYANGTIDDHAVQLPDAFSSIGTRKFELTKPDYSREYRTLTRQLRLVLNSLPAFEILMDSDEFQSLDLPVIARRDFALSILKRIPTALKHYAPCNESNSRDIARAWIDDYCSSALADYWTQFHSYDLPQFDFDGIRLHLESLDSIENRHAFLEEILCEMAQPVSCALIDRNQERHNRLSGYDWKIVLFHRHAISPDEEICLRNIRHDLRLQRDRNMQREMGGHDDSADGSSVQAPLATAHHLIEWMAHQVDLVFIIDALKEAGYCRATDAVIVDHFDYRSQSKDKAKTYRDMRKKLREGTSYADRARLDHLIRILTEGRR